MVKEKGVVVIHKMEDNNKKLHGILGLILNAFYFFIGAHYFTFGVKWEIKHIQSNEEKIENMEKSINYLMEHSPLDEEKYNRYLDISEQEGVDPITHQRL